MNYNDQDNAELQLAFDFVQCSDRNIFLTGKAGTGKTTFLHRLREKALKRMIVVAPTGVAAINAAGVTIHSFFQLPFSPFVPGASNAGGERGGDAIYKMGKEKLKIIKTLDLVVIDEISMVRADLLDAIDNVLRRYRDRQRPFGGVQLLMIGDLHQLSPVAREDDWNILRQYYETPFFISSLALKETNFITIELKHIYRQRDLYFVNLLNRIRSGKVDQEVLGEINKRFDPNWSSNEELSRHIVLTTHNRTADNINGAKLNQLSSGPQAFKASVSGDFPEYSYPTEYELCLKVGAQVMFVKNDISKDKLYYNGKIGTIERIDSEKEIIHVKSYEDEVPIAVGRVSWQNMKYTLNEVDNSIDEDIIGTFTQFPLKLAWAITIHKSQGLTFDNLVIDAKAAFAHGQVYVALSRCRTIEGLVLSSLITKRGIITDEKVDEFIRNIEKNMPTAEELSAAKIDYQKALLQELFDFTSLHRLTNYCLKIIREHQASLVGNPYEKLAVASDLLKAGLVIVSEKFASELQQHLKQDANVENNLPLQERIRKACAYFSEKLWVVVEDKLSNIIVETDNQSVRKSLFNALDRLKQECSIKLLCLSTCKSGFVVKSYLQTKVAATIDTLGANTNGKAKKQKNKSAVVSTNNSKEELLSSQEILSHTKHPELFEKIKEWRTRKAKDLNVPVFMVLHQKVLLEISNLLPLSNGKLQAIKGVGKKKMQAYSRELISMVSAYCDKKGIAHSEVEPRQTMLAIDDTLPPPLPSDLS
ncbi:MAG: AAA family ATPase [Oligoflexia bacterium]|nr:AAA family ATPase [Oligoflexia bacterium]MBF0364624.1 AAA family ATPase [Oligoflexia bacterium]